MTSYTKNYIQKFGNILDEGIKTMHELSQKGSHNEGTRDKYKSNPNIRIED